MESTDALISDAGIPPGGTPARPALPVRLWALERGSGAAGYVLSLITRSGEQARFELDATDILNMADAVLDDALRVADPKVARRP